MSYTEIFQLDKKINAMERELSTLKYRRKKLKLAVAMRAKWRTDDFRQKAIAAIKERIPAATERLMKFRHNAEKLPWPDGTKQRNRYRALRRAGWTKDAAVEKVKLEQRQTFL